MALITKKVKGTEDILPSQSYKWRFVEKIMQEEAENFGYKEMRTPVFENTELFMRSVGETTDVVQKEMYTFTTKGEDSVTLRPEGTAGAARAMLEHALFNEGLPVKINYFTSCYRYEKPQAGRLREFHQFGLECYGTSDPIADAEMISAADSIFNRLQLQDVRLEVNSIGCPVCRKNYYESLQKFFGKHTEELCGTCNSRLERNPMRILDCKSLVCSEINKNAPIILDFLCEECETHFLKVKNYLDASDIKYVVNPRIVRGLDYYTKTVFEFISGSIGAQSTICGGGRYDGLISELGGQQMPSLGFAIGLERVLMVIEAQKIEIEKPNSCDLYIAALGEKAQIESFKIVKELRQGGLFAELDVLGRGLRAQMKYADKIKSKFSMVLGDNEVDAKIAKVKNMQSGETFDVALDDDFFVNFSNILIDFNTKIFENL